MTSGEHQMKRMGAGQSLPVVDGVRRCRECGCTDDNACWPPCWWVAADLCSTCGEGQPGDLVQRPPC